MAQLNVVELKARVYINVDDKKETNSDLILQVVTELHLNYVNFFSGTAQACKQIRKFA